MGVICECGFAKVVHIVVGSLCNVCVVLLHWNEINDLWEDVVVEIVVVGGDDGDVTEPCWSTRCTR